MAGMTKNIARMLSPPLFLAAPLALAQSATPPADEAPAASMRVEVTPVLPVAPGPPQASQRETELAEKLNALEIKVAGLEETTAASQAEIAKSSKLKFSGFVQGRYEWHQDAFNGATTFLSSGAAKSTNTDRFMVRHAYLTTQYKGTNAEQTGKKVDNDFAMAQLQARF
jgi:hypothetical protein